MTAPQLEELAARIAQQTGVTIERARVIASANLTPRGAGAIASAPAVAPSILADQDGRAEKAQQHDICKLWLTLGGKVWDTSAVTRSKITPGIPDLFLTLPAWRFAMWFETKSAEAVRRKETGRSPAQVEFGEHALAARIEYGVGTFRDFVRHLILISPITRQTQILAAVDKAGLTTQAGVLT